MRCLGVWRSFKLAQHSGQTQLDPAGDSTPIWVYFLIPVLSGIVGYLTNVAAVWMTFNPVEFWPILLWRPEGQPWGFFGWQGIIPAKAVVMTQTLCDVFIDKVLDVSTIFARVDPKHIARLTHAQLQVLLSACQHALCLHARSTR